MFDADNGDLLWYADSNAPAIDPNEPPASSTGGVKSETTAHLVNSDLQYSVVSEIKTIDRNNDGLIDHIYFGDLAGQAFRVDFKNDASKTVNTFNSQITKILDLHAAKGTSPRFYLPPVFTAHHSAGRLEGGNIVVASFISGNKSSPLLATNDSPSTTGQTTSTDLSYDGVYAIYEYDIFPTGVYFPATRTAAKTLAGTSTTASLTQLMKLTTLVNKSTTATSQGATIDPTSGWGGWYYQFDKNFDGAPKNQAVIKGLTPLIAMEGSLYTTMYDASEAGTSTACGAGVKGKSFTQRICLPTGVCPEDANYKYDLGAGIVSVNVGPMTTDSDKPGGVKSLVVPETSKNTSPCTGGACTAGKTFIPAGGALKFIPNRWFERYAKAS